MKTNQFLKVKDRIDSINTSETYTQQFFLIEHYLILPLLNLDLIDEVIGNPKRVRVEFAYLLLEDVAEINWVGRDQKGKEIIAQLSLQSKKKKMTDWFAFNAKGYGYELKINFSDVELFIPTLARIGDDWWTPYDTPNFKQNMDAEKMEAFFKLEMLPTHPKFEKSKKQVLRFCTKKD